MLDYMRWKVKRPAVAGSRTQDTSGLSYLPLSHDSWTTTIPLYDCYVWIYLRILVKAQPSTRSTGPRSPTRLGIRSQDLGLPNEYSLGHCGLSGASRHKLAFTSRHMHYLAATDTTAKHLNSLFPVWGKMLWAILCSLFRWITGCKWHYLSYVVELCYCPHCFTLLLPTFRLFQLVSTVFRFFQLPELVSDCHSVTSTATWAQNVWVFLSLR